MNEYELMTILSPRLNAEESAALVESIEGQIVEHGGELLSTDVWGRRRLAYPIGASMEGTYVLFTLKLPPEGTVLLETGLRLSERVLRHLLIRGIIPYQGQDRDRERDFEHESERASEEEHAEERAEEQPVAAGVASGESAAEAPAAEEAAPAAPQATEDAPAATADADDAPEVATAASEDADEE